MKLAKDSTGSAERYSPPRHDFELLNKRCIASRPNITESGPRLRSCRPRRPNRDASRSSTAPLQL